MKAGEKRDLVCITCPLGCRLTIFAREDGGLEVSGNLCPRGARYAEDEVLDPRRVVTATCRTDSERHPRLPVRTESSCPKDRIEALLERIYSHTAKLPVKAGDLLFTDETGTRVLAARTLKD